MRFSLQVHYAVCGMFDLAYNGLDQPVQVRVIGERQRIPTRYLEQIFQRLRRARLVAGKRGPGGGYRLARPAAEISLREVVEAVEGPVGIGPGPGEEALGTVPGRPDFVWPELAERFAHVLDQVTLADLCRRAAKEGVARLSPPVFDYQI
jgi:Rrf2 family protein